MFGLPTMFQMIFSKPMFGVWTVPESAAPLSTPARTIASISGRILSSSVFRMITIATGEKSLPRRNRPSSGG